MYTLVLSLIGLDILLYSVTSLSDRALNAMNNLFILINKVKLDVRNKLLLFDRIVVQVVTYSADIWVIYQFKEVKNLHIKFCKRILGVGKQAMNITILWEQGRFPLSICLERSLKYWLEIKCNSNSLMHRIFQEQCHMLNNNNNCSNIWAAKVKVCLNSPGLTYLCYKRDLQR